MSTDTAGNTRPRLRWVTPPARDAGLAAGLCLVDVLVFSSITVTAGGPGALVLALAGFAPLAWRTIAPVPVFFAVWFLTLTSALAVPELRPVLALLVATYTVASRTDRKTSIIAATLAVPTGIVVAVRTELGQNPNLQAWTIVLSVGLIAGMLNLGPWVLGRWVQANRRRMANLELARQRDAERARIDERRQIALELHDIVSHSVTVMVLQADGARAVLRTDPSGADEALRHIAKVGRSSVGELRRLLGLLNDGTLAETAGEGGGLDDLPAVIEEAEQTGLIARLEVSGHQPAVPTSFERTVHRIVKETLTNARKHGGHGNMATVQLFWSDNVLVINVADNASGEAADGTLSTGHGLAGLQERVKAVDGRLTAGPNPDGHGFVVTATLPIPVLAATLGPAPSTASQGA